MRDAYWAIVWKNDSELLAEENGLLRIFDCKKAASAFLSKVSDKRLFKICRVSVR